jgi:ATP-dependent helicase/DNAse subunit B
MEYYNDIGLVGMGSYSEPGDWFTYELNHYIIARASWNVEFDMNSLLEEYFNLRYGDAGPEIKRYFWLIEETVRKGNRIVNTAVPSLEEMDVYLSNLEECEILLEKAKKLVKDNKRVQHLLEKLSLSLEYANLDMNIRKKSLQLARDHISGGAKELEQLYQRMTEIFNENLNEGVFISRGDMYYK